MVSRTTSINNIEAWKQLQQSVANATAGLSNAFNGVVAKVKGTGQQSYSQAPTKPASGQQSFAEASAPQAGQPGSFAQAPPTQQIVGTAVEGQAGQPIAQCPAGMIPTEDGMGCMYVSPMTPQQQQVFLPAPNTNANYYMGRKVLGSGCACGR